MLVIELFADQAVVEDQLGWQLGLVQLRLIRHVFIRVVALVEVDVVVTEIPDGVRKFLHSQLSHLPHEVVEGGGEKLTRAHEDDIADPQQNVSLAVQRNNTHVGVCCLGCL